MSQDDKNRSWCHGEGTKREVSRARRLSSDFGQFLARRTDYESHQAKLRAAASSDTLAFDALNAQLSQGGSGTQGSSSLLSLNQATSSSGRVARWAVNIDAVLNDPLGRIAFRHFLKLEFSEENIQFWIDCENFRQAMDHRTRDYKEIIESIIRKYVGEQSDMPVNLPGPLEESALANREVEKPSFEAHQKHIYDVMKFDSYPRFIRSEHYRRLVQLELTNNFVTEHDITNAYKKGGPSETQEDKKKKKTAFKLLKSAVNPIRHRRLSGDMKNQKMSIASEPTCFIHFSDGKNCNVTLRAGITVSEMLKEVAAYNQVDNQMVDWLLIGENSADELTMEQDSLVLKDKHIRAEMRVTFRLDILKLQRRIAIRAKTHKPIGETIRPIIKKYTPELSMDQIIIRAEGSANLINLDEPVLTLSNQRIVMDTVNRSPEISLRHTEKRINRSHMLKTTSKKKKRRDSFGPLKRMRKTLQKNDDESDKAAKSPDLFSDATTFSTRCPEPLMRGSPFDDDFKSRSRRSTTFGGQIDTQRGLLNKESLTLPKFLANTGEAPTIDPDDSFNKHRLDNNCSWDGNEDGLDGCIPNPNDAYKLFGSSNKAYPDPASNNTSSSSGGPSSSIDGPTIFSYDHNHFDNNDAEPEPDTETEMVSSEWELFSSGSLRKVAQRYDELATADSLPSLTDTRILRRGRNQAMKITKSQSSPASLSQQQNAIYKKIKSTIV